MNDIVVLRLPASHCTPLTEAELRGELRGLSGDGAMIRGGFQRLAKLGKIKYFGGGCYVRNSAISANMSSVSGFLIIRMNGYTVLCAFFECDRKLSADTDSR